MFSKNNIPKNVHQTGSRKSSLQDREHKVPFPPSKKPRPAENCMPRQAGVEDDIWGDELDANSVEECFLLASQALSQVCITNEVWQLPSFSPQFNDSIAACEFFLLFFLHLFLSLQAKEWGFYRGYFSWCCMQKLPHFDHTYFCFFVVSFFFLTLIFVCVKSKGKDKAPCCESVWRTGVKSACI